MVRCRVKKSFEFDYSLVLILIAGLSKDMCFIATDWHKAELEQTNLSRTQLIQKAMTDGRVSKLSLNCTSEPSHWDFIFYKVIFNFKVYF